MAGALIKLSADAPAYRAESFMEVLEQRKFHRELGDVAGADPMMTLAAGTELIDDGRTGEDNSPDAGFARWQSVRGVPGDESARYWVPRELIVAQGEDIDVGGQAPSAGASSGESLFWGLLLVGALLYFASEG
jgi:hypothetical protein